MVSSLSYREKSLYASLVTEIVVYGPYLFLHQQNSLHSAVGMIIAMIVLQIILQSIIAALTRNRITDERDRLIELRGFRVGYYTVVTLMVVGLGMLWFDAAIGHFPLDSRILGLHFLNIFFAILAISDITRTATQIVAYRRGL